MRRTPTSLRLRVPLVVLASIFAVSCSRDLQTSGASVRLLPAEELPEPLQTAPLAVRDAYRFAAANPDVSRQLPCYCGCGAMGHTSNYACFVASVQSDGAIMYDSHAFG